jgi:hypothetical protein
MNADFAFFIERHGRSSFSRADKRRAIRRRLAEYAIALPPYSTASLG